MNPAEIADMLIIIMLGALGLVIVVAIAIGISQHLLQHYWPKFLCRKFDIHPEPYITFQDDIYETIAKCEKCNKVIYKDTIIGKWCECEDQTRIL